MKHLVLIFIVLVLGNKSQEGSTTLQSNNFSNQNLKQEGLTGNSISTQESQILNNLDFLKSENLETSLNSQMLPQPVRIKFYNNTTQEQINESLEFINPMGSLRCVDGSTPNAQVYVIFIIGDGRGSGSGGSGTGDNVIQSIPYIQSYRIGEICN